ncbi:MAG: AcrR family transcriptional regulator [Janthinobacterium sp.]|jgi:AcrR family transcriptional regulator
MTTEIKTRKRSETPRLKRDDWLDAAFGAVVDGGFDNIRVLAIADTLKVTRGSFYWHFADHADLVTSLLARWRAREVAMDSALQAAPEIGPQADLERLLEAALSRGGDDMENMRFELALRALGRRAPDVAQMLVEIDQLRMDVFEKKFLRLTGDPKSAAELAALFYLSIVGSYQALSRPSVAPQLKQYLGAIIANYLIARQAPASGAAPTGPDLEWPDLADPSVN